MRDLLVFSVVMVSLPLAFRRPFVGLLLFSWLAYMRPQDLCWSFARTMRFSFIVGLVMLVGWFANESHFRRFWRRDLRTVVMIALLGVTTVSLAFAQRSFADQGVMRHFLEFAKIITIALFTTGQVDTKQRLRMLLWTICACLAFFGVKDGVLGVLQGGTPILRGPGGMLEDNNDFALALVMNIPMLFYLGRLEDKAWVRTACDIAVILTLITILLTHSRGGFLAAVATLLLMAWRSRRLVQAVGALGLGVVLFFLFAPTHVVVRIASIAEGGAEASASARLRSWNAALGMIGDYPVLGVGMRNFREYYAEYVEGYVPGEQMSYVAHNSFLQIWAENGWIAFGLYLVLLGSMFSASRWLRQIGRKRQDLHWIGTYARMMEATTFGFIVGAMFLNRGHFDLIYHWFGLMTCLVFIAKRELALAPARAPEPAAARTVREPVAVGWQRTPQPRMLPRWGR